jgi:hypothetical protein
LSSWFLLSYNGSFAKVWINTSLNNQALTLAPDNLLLFSSPGAVGVSEAQKRWCAHLGLTPELRNKLLTSSGPQIPEIESLVFLA